MEMLDESRLAICEWETSGMEEKSCFGEEEGFHRQNTLIQRLIQTQKRLTRVAQFLAVVLLVFSVALVLQVALLLGRRDPQTPGSQHMIHPERNSSDISVKQQQHEIGDIYPSAMLTAPYGSYTHVKCLEWQSDLGNAHCQGGFNYSSGNLVVPRYGKYKVYLQITYESDSMKCRGPEMTLTNRVFVLEESYTKGRALLSSIDTVSCSMKQWSKSLHTQGSFVLEANSRLWVTSSHHDLIVKKEELTFFGAEFQTDHVSIT